MIGKGIRKINLAVVNFAVVFVLLCAASYILIATKHYAVALGVMIFFTLFTALNLVLLFARQRERVKCVKTLSFYAEETGCPDGAIPSFKLPLVFLSQQGTYIWSNTLFAEIFSGKDEMQRALHTLYLVHLRGKFENQELLTPITVTFGDRTFRMMTDIVRMEKNSPDSFAIMLYFTEVTELVRVQRDFQSRQTAVAEIAIDSYQEIFQASGEAVINAISVELAKIFEKWLADTDAVIKKLVRDRYILLVEETALQRLEKDKFTVLNMVKKISVGNRIPVTLSIGIGAHGPSIAANYEAAAKALELALSRGGDQAVVRVDGKDTYFGGSNIELESLSKVKARLIASLLKKEIQKSSRVLIMGHQTADMDSLGATLCIYRICCFLGIPAKIILNESNPAIEAMLSKLQTSTEYAEVFINTSYALNLVDDDTLAVVVDTSRQSMTESPKLLEYAPRIAVFDHHRKAADYLQNTVLDYSEIYASSTSELLIEVLQYMIPHASLPVREAEAMYAGILVDTKNFTFKTGTRTFEVASYLRSQGVDTVGVRQYFQPDLETYAAVSRVTASAKLIEGRIAVAHCPDSVKNQKLVTAMAADQLLNIAGVDASFVLCERDADTAISARSLGEINVQVILEKLGGGGHLTAAAALVKERSSAETETELTRFIMEYLEK